MKIKKTALRVVVACLLIATTGELSAQEKRCNDGSQCKQQTKQSNQRKMATVTFKNSITINLNGSLPALGSQAPDFKLTGKDLGDITLASFAGKRLVLNIFPSIDTGVCAASVRRFNQELSKLDNTAVLCVSKDLPFAQARFCGAEGLDAVVVGSAFRHLCFEDGYGVLMQDGPLAGLLARAVVVIDEKGKVVYTELVPEIAQDPNFEAALAALK